jgi:hypothetical protein
MGNIILGHVWYHQVMQPYTQLGTLADLPLEVRDLVYTQILINAKFANRRLDVEDDRIFASSKYTLSYFPFILFSSSAISNEAALVAPRLNILVVRTILGVQALTSSSTVRRRERGGLMCRSCSFRGSSGLRHIHQLPLCIH